MPYKISEILEPVYEMNLIQVFPNLTTVHIFTWRYQEQVVKLQKSSS
jgi:hypothetical protein